MTTIPAPSSAAGCPLCQRFSPGLDQPPIDPHSVAVVAANQDFVVIRVEDAGLPGFHRLIWRNHVCEMTDLPPTKQQVIFDALVDWETRLRQAWPCDKFNLASFGNVVPHLHWHLMPRWRTDPWWPNPIWGQALPMQDEAIRHHGADLRRLTGSWAQLKALASPVRQAVFIEEQGVEPEEEWDVLDDAARHVVICQAETAIANGRLLSLGNGSARLGRMAVLPDHRQRGIGSLVLDALMLEATRLGCSEIVLHAQLPALPFYEAAGFEAEGPVFEECRIPHRLMRGRLTC